MGKAKERHMYPHRHCWFSVLLSIPGLSLLPKKLTRESTTEKKIIILWKLSLIFMQMICFNSISDTSMSKPVCSYALLKLAMLWGWRCCQSCFCWTASCWDWSEVDRRFTSGDTQFAGMIKPTIRCPSSVLSRTICIFTFVPLTDARTPSTFVQTLRTEPHNT